ncbi:hypothetical protein HF086_005597 [Spodoptera exigua]|uniref:Uncharacterized protein n=1 Tax=Spodoptera exigua TaxID=7107 RepID=A0A922MZ49_SPOEX|nr:hypothetical protein HF086_005597 [Spodoptera exigua]
MDKTESIGRSSIEGCMNIDLMRSLVKQYSELGQWTSALFWADAAAAAAGGGLDSASGDDVWLLASAMLARGELHRAAHAVTSRGLHRERVDRVAPDQLAAERGGGRAGPRGVPAAPAPITAEAEAVGGRMMEAAQSRARRLAAACRWTEALRALDTVDPWCCVEAKSLEPSAGCVWLAYGHSFAADNEHDQAMAAYFKASQLMSGCHLPPLYVGVECSLLNNFTMCERFLTRAATLHSNAKVKVSPRWAATLDALGHACRALGRPREALGWHGRALALRPARAGTLCAMGLCQALLGRERDAAALLHAALAHDPDDVVALAGRQT